METLADQWKQQGAQQERHRAEEWIKQEKDKWERQAELKATQRLIVEILTERFDVVGSGLTQKIYSIESLDILNGLFRKTQRVDSLEEFSKLVDKALET